MIELQQFGWNLVTFGFIGAMVTTCFGFWGIINQNRTIWRLKSGASVSVVMFTYGTMFFCSGCVYGFHIGSLALIVTGIRALLQVSVLIGLWKFKGFRCWEKIAGLAFIVVLVAMILLPHKDIFYFAISLGAIATFIPQPLEMLKNRSRGAVSVGFLWTIFAGVGFWSVFSIAIGDWVLSIVNPIFLVFVIATLVIWYAMPSGLTEEAAEVSDD